MRRQQSGGKDSLKKSKYSDHIQDNQIPSLYQIESMFQKNGFRNTNVVTKDQLKQLFDRQYALNNLEQFNQSQKFSEQLFDELWGQLQTLSDSTVKIQNVCQVLYQALKILSQRLKLINGSKGIKSKESELQKLEQKQKQLTNELDLVDAELDYYQQKIKSERNGVRMNIGKLKTQIEQLLRDRQNFEFEIKMLLLTIGEHEEAPVETKIIQQNVLSMFGIQKKTSSNDLKFIFILTVISLVIQLLVLTYRYSFFTILGLFVVLYLLFLGYYNEKTVVYLIIYFFVSILLDLGYVFLNVFTKLIVNPIVYTENTFLKFIAMILILVSSVLRLILIGKLFKYREIPKNLQYFDFWGQQIVLNRRSKKYGIGNTNILN